VLSADAWPPDQTPDPHRVILVPFLLWCPHPGDPAPADDRCGDPLAARSDAGPPLAAATLPALRRAMVLHLQSLGHGDAEPLRWAITAVDPLLGLRLEGVAVVMAALAPGDFGEAETGG
jgi:hypothetical protein